MADLASVQSAVEDAWRMLGPDPVTPVLVVVNDPARSTPTGPVLDVLLEHVPALSMEILVATGTHRFDDEVRSQHERLHGLQRAAAIHWHDARAPELSRALLDRPWPVLAIGSVEPHWFAGWTGAHKTLTVGVWPRARIERNHAHAIEATARAAVLDGNPVFEGLARAVETWTRARDAPVAAVNVVGELEGAAGGAPLEALRQVLPAARARFVDLVDAPLDRLVAYVDAPLDRSLYQALKGVTNHAHAVRDGGALVLVASCPNGVGIDHFMTPLRAGLEYDALRAAVERDGYALGDHKALRQRQLCDQRGLSLAIVPAADAPFDADDLVACGFDRFDAPDDALRWAREVAPGPREHVVRDAGNRVTSVDD